MSAYRIDLRRDGLLKLLQGGEVILRDNSNLLDPLELRLVLHPECRNLVSIEPLTR